VKPRALDLFCGAGGAGMGLHQAGFDVVGVDIKPQPRYPFTFHQADALTFPLDGFDFIWASPPCQFASIVTPVAHRGNHHNFIPDTRERMQAADVPFAIENVGNARSHLHHPLMLCGSMFGLRCWRHRYFELSPRPLILTPPCYHAHRPLLVTTAGAHSRKIRKPGEYKSVKNAPAAYGIDWMDAKGLAEAIPPAYSRYIGEQMMPHVIARKECAA
jgi:DNA (cytosine-5)-methyltransferase 1